MRWGDAIAATVIILGRRPSWKAEGVLDDSPASAPRTLPARRSATWEPRRAGLDGLMLPVENDAPVPVAGADAATANGEAAEDEDEDDAGEESKPLALALAEALAAGSSVAAAEEEE